MSDVHRDNPDATPEEIDALQRAQLLGIGQYARERKELPDSITRQCRDCGEDFTISAIHADKHTKWFSMCSYCLANEL